VLEQETLADGGSISGDFRQFVVAMNSIADSRVTWIGGSQAHRFIGARGAMLVSCLP